MNIILSFLKSSITRLCVLIVTVTGCYCAIYGLLKNKDLTDLGIFVGIILGCGFGGKYFNKKLENTRVKK